MRKVVILLMVFYSSITLSNDEKLKPLYTHEQCIHSIERLTVLNQYKNYLAVPLENKKEILSSFDNIKKIITSEKPVIVNCWVHYKSLNLVNVLSALEIASKGFDTAYPNADSLLQHDTMFKVYAKQQLQLVNNVNAYNKARH